MKISNRLLAIYNLIDTKVIYDVGCDHAHLSIYFVLNKGDKAFAIDCNKNALANAINNVNDYNVADKVITVLNDGLEGILKFDNSTVVLSGMGTTTILNIISNKDINHIVIQSNNDLELLRKEMNKRGYFINNEVVVHEGKIYNVVISFKKGIRKYNYSDYVYGPIIKRRLNHKDIDYLKYLLRINKLILYQLPKKKIICSLIIKFKVYTLNRIINNL